MELDKRVSQLEQGAAKREERWSNHDKDAEKRQQEIREGFAILREEIAKTANLSREDIQKIFDKLNQLQCGVHEERMRQINRAIVALREERKVQKEDNKWVIALICGTPGIILAVIKIFEILAK